jgi:hypothetical protein
VTDRDDSGVREIYVMNSDGSAPARITNNNHLEDDPKWSPDGSKIAFVAPPEGYGGASIYTMNPDGSGTASFASAYSASECDSFWEYPYADWAPDSSAIAYDEYSVIFVWDFGCFFESEGHSVYVRHLAGGPPVFIGGGRMPVWSPDGDRIVVEAGQYPDFELYVIEADGSGGRSFLAPGFFPDWQPTTRQGFARPKNAASASIKLVPAYKACTSPNSTHGAPLALSSCGPPIAESGHATTGEGKFVGTVGFQVVGESPINLANGDQADVQLYAIVTDVRRPDSSDYSGELRVAPTLRITDRSNGGQYSPPIHPATATDTPLGFTITCTPTEDATVGSTCSGATTADAVMPGIAQEAKRAVWQLGQVLVYDGGADGDADTTGDNTLFATQGLFAP